MSMLDEVQCPYCGEPGEVAADYDPESPGDQVFVQDCEVCCNPWQVTVTRDRYGDPEVRVERAQ
jgi:hypothetical protein